MAVASELMTLRKAVSPLIARAKLSPHEAIRQYETEYRELGLEDRKPAPTSWTCS